MSTRNSLVAAIGATFVASSTLAAVSADEAKQLGGATLTLWGAEKAGNKDGTIPAWTGERIKAPSTYDPKDPRLLPSPWQDKPLFSITAQNMEKYADRLTEGQKALLKKYPNYRMDIYPSRRTASFPKYVLDNTVKNATSCKTVANGVVLQDCHGGFPFPIPKTGNEVMWNHVARFTLHSWELVAGSYMVDSKGSPILTSFQTGWQILPFYDPQRTGAADAKEIYYTLRFDQTEPPRVAGQKYLIIDALDMVNVGRRVYSYIPGQRRVKLAPDLSYDTPNPVSGGSTTMDQVMGFLGPQDRYDFKLVGKQEKYLMYNNYELADYKTCPNEKQLTKNFINPDCVRWEPHRVWVVEATLKPGFRHILPKRTFYFDEDTYGATATDDYDAAGRMYRVVMVPYHHLYNLNGYGNIADRTLVFDLQTGIWASTALVAKKDWGYREVPAKPKTFYSPEALAGEGVR